MGPSRNININIQRCMPFQGVHLNEANIVSSKRATLLGRFFSCSKVVVLWSLCFSHCILYKDKFHRQLSSHLRSSQTAKGIAAAQVSEAARIVSFQNDPAQDVARIVFSQYGRGRNSAAVNHVWLVNRRLLDLRLIG